MCNYAVASRRAAACGNERTRTRVCARGDVAWRCANTASRHVGRVTVGCGGVGSKPDSGMEIRDGIYGVLWSDAARATERRHHVRIHVNVKVNITKIHEPIVV